MSVGDGAPGSAADEDDSTTAESPAQRLSLGDPLEKRASEDLPDSWGERFESDADRLVRYRAQRPPHHGG